MRSSLLLTGILIVSVMVAAETGTSPVRKRSTRRKTTAAVHAGPGLSASRQNGPTIERYKQIQESLISRGYMQGPATGVWDQNSMDAMQKFQTSQNLEPTGKITAKALINLGLGPQDEGATSKSK